MRLLALVCVLATSACSSSAPSFGFAVALSIDFDASVTETELGDVTQLVFVVPEEQFDKDVVLGRHAMRIEETVYRPNAGATVLTFQIAAQNAAGVTIASGTTSSTVLAGRTVSATVTLHAVVGTDGGLDAHDAGHDGSPDADGGSTLSFVTTPLLATAHQPVGVAIADFNGDGNNDVAVAALSGKVQLFFADSKHHLPTTPSAVISTIAMPGALATGDFNGDGSPDLVVPDRSTRALYYLFNDRHGTLTAAANPQQTVPKADLLIVADFDGDGKANDVAVTSSTQTGIYVHVNGTTPQAIPYTTPSPVTGVHAANFNGDKKADLLYAELAGNTFGVRMGPATTNTTEQLFAFNGPQDALVYDFAGSGAPQALLIGAYNLQMGENALLLNNDSGALARDSNMPSGFGNIDSGLSRASTLDFVGDGHPTAVTSHDGNDTSVPLTTFNFLEVTQISTINQFPIADDALYVSGTQPDMFAVGDLDGDGSLDIAAINAGSDTVAIYRQLAGGALYAAPAFTLYPGYYFSQADFNADGVPDLLGNLGNYIGLYAEAQGSFAHQGAFQLTSPNITPSHAASGDLNKDGLQDLVFGTYQGMLGVTLGTGTGLYAAESYSKQLATTTVLPQLVDLDGDTNLDVVQLADVTSGNANGNNVLVMFGNGKGQFGLTPGSTSSTANGYSVQGAVAFAVTDVDGDKKPDLLVLSSTPARITVLHNQGTGVFTIETPITSAVTTPSGFAVADFDGDGHVDVAISGDTLHVMRGDGKNDFTDNGAVLSGVSSSAVATNDMDGDGHPDLVVATSDALVRIFAARQTSFIPFGSYASGAYVTQVFAADFTGDKKIDIVTVGAQAAILVNDTP